MAVYNNWENYSFEVIKISEAREIIKGGVFIFAVKEKSLMGGIKWKAHFIGETSNFQSLKSARLSAIWHIVEPLGECYVHTLQIGEIERKLLVDKLILICKPFLNLPKYEKSMVCEWNDYSFFISGIEEACQNSEAGVFIFASEKENICEAHFIGETDNFQKLKSLSLWNKAKEIGTTDVHILAIADAKERKSIVENLVETYEPSMNQSEKLTQSKQKEENMSDNDTEITGQLSETKSKLELLYQYEKHYLELIKEYKEEIKFANSLQEDLRRERSQFFTQTLKEVVQTMKAAEVDKSVSAQWIQDLVASYTKSIDLSGDLAKTHVIEILSILTAETKREASEAKLDNVGKNN